MAKVIEVGQRLALGTHIIVMAWRSPADGGTVILEQDDWGGRLWNAQAFSFDNPLPYAYATTRTKEAALGAVLVQLSIDKRT